MICLGGLEPVGTGQEPWRDTLVFGVLLRDWEKGVLTISQQIFDE